MQFGCYCCLIFPQLSLQICIQYVDVKAGDIEGIQDSGSNTCTLRSSSSAIPGKLQYPIVSPLSVSNGTQIDGIIHNEAPTPWRCA